MQATPQAGTGIPGIDANSGGEAGGALPTLEGANQSRSGRTQISSAIQFSRLVVAANAGFFAVGTNGEFIQPPGGLTSAVAPVLGGIPGSIAVSANTVSQNGKSSLVDVSSWTDRPFAVEGVSLPYDSYERYYRDVSNGCFWPVLHELPQFNKPYSDEAWNDYRNINAQFASKLLEIHKPGDLIWIHDYHQMLSPAFVRLREPDAQIAYFHHIPFPKPEIFNAHIPEAHGKAILRGLLGADLVGFHTRTYAMNFLTAVRDAEIGATVDFGRRTVTIDGRTISVGWFPISIDVEKVRTAAESRVAQLSCKELLSKVLAHTNPDKVSGLDLNELVALKRETGVQILFGVERLDYTKGLKERMLAFEALLERQPALAEKVLFLQHAAPSRETVQAYAEYRAELEGIAQRINKRFGSATWQPMVFKAEKLELPQILGFARAADVIVVTPLKDGMNLGIKECVIGCGDQPKAFVLGQGAGAAEELVDCILVDGGSSRSIRQGFLEALALVAQPEEALRRTARLKETIDSYPVSAWSASFLQASGEAVEARIFGIHPNGGILERQGSSAARAATPNSEAEISFVDPKFLGQKLAGAGPVVFVLPYDGCLHPIVAHRESAELDGPRKSDLFELAGRVNTTLLVVSGRPHLELNRFCSHLRGRSGRVWTSAIHGGDLRNLDSAMPPETVRDSMGGLERLIAPVVMRLEQRLGAGSGVVGIDIEDKGSCVAVHYRNQPRMHDRVLSEVRDSLRAAEIEAAFRIVEGDLTIELVPREYSQVDAISKVLRHEKGAGPGLGAPTVVVLGNGATPPGFLKEANAAIRSLGGRGVTVHVGGAAPDKEAQWSLPNIHSVYTMIRAYAEKRDRA